MRRHSLIRADALFAGDSMATFFEKVTNPPAPASLQEEPVAEEARHLAVAREDEIAPQEREEETENEEGELTVDIYDKGDSIVIQSTVAGVSPEDLDVSITNDSVAIRGSRERKEEVDEKDFFYKELFWGNFTRSIILPEEIEEDAAEATLKHGLLTIHLPKRRKGVAQKVKVKVN